MSFLNRADAARQLADVLRGRHPIMPLVVGMTHGGVPVGAELARLLHAPFDICIVRSLVSPAGTVYGAVAEGGATYVDFPHARRLGIGPFEVDRAVEHERLDVERLRQLFRDRSPPIPARGFDAILVDDGLVGHELLRAAILSLRSRGVFAIELAVPLASTSALDAVRAEVDHVTYLEVDPYLTAIGARYKELRPVSDAEVMDELAGARVQFTSIPTLRPRAHT